MKRIVYLAIVAICVAGIECKPTQILGQCSLSDWDDLGKCTNGFQIQVRTVKNIKNIFQDCGPLIRKVPCADCVVSKWDGSMPCVSDKKTITRKIVVKPVGTGKACPALSKVIKCNDCVVTDWDTTKPCVNKRQTQTRKIIKPATKRGTCVPLTRTVDCNDCTVGPWNTTGPCTNGKQVQTRQVTVAQTNGGICFNLTQTVTCNNCVQSDWKNSGTCDKDTGKQTQTRTITSQPTNGGTACGESTQTVDCDVDCMQSEWKNNGTCDPATGLQNQMRTVVTAKKNNGAACEPDARTVTCRVDCMQSDWADSGTCNKSSGKIEQTRMTVITAKNNGTACGPSTRFSTCAVDCEVSAWSNSGKCTDGMINQTRTITVEPKNGGKACSMLEQSVDCNDCIVSAWNTTGPCTNGTQTQTRTVTTPEKNGGTCMPLTRDVDCNDCVVSEWDMTNVCNSNTGTQTQTRTVITSETNGGMCFPLTREVDCRVDCVQSMWTNDGPCDMDEQTQTRTVLITAKNGGTACGNSSRVVDCCITNTYTIGNGISFGQSYPICGCLSNVYFGINYYDFNGILSDTLPEGAVVKYVSTSVAGTPCYSYYPTVAINGVTVATYRGNNGCQCDDCSDKQFESVDFDASTYMVGKDNKLDIRQFYYPTKIEITVSTCSLCQYSDWVDSGSCDQQTGKQAQTRTITSQPTNGGIACGELTRTVDCCITKTYMIGNGISYGEINGTCGTGCLGDYYVGNYYTGTISDTLPEGIIVNDVTVSVTGTPCENLTPSVIINDTPVADYRERRDVCSCEDCSVKQLTPLDFNTNTYMVGKENTLKVFGFFFKDVEIKVSACPLANSI